MTKQIISTLPNAPSSSLYSQGIRVGSTVYVSGMIGIDQTTSELAGPTVQEQTRQAVHNRVAVLEAGGGIRGDIVYRSQSFLYQPPSDLYAGMNEVHTLTNQPSNPHGRSPKQNPGRRTVGVLVSIMMIAQLRRLGRQPSLTQPATLLNGVPTTLGMMSLKLPETGREARRQTSRRPCL
jgi:2-iminobutanoate/2-iminopropanoate deaminase